MRHHGRQMPTQLLLLVLQWNGKERKIIQAIRQATYTPLSCSPSDPSSLLPSLWKGAPCSFSSHDTGLEELGCLSFH